MWILRPKATKDPVNFVKKKLKKSKINPRRKDGVPISSSKEKQIVCLSPEEELQDALMSRDHLDFKPKNLSGAQHWKLPKKIRK